MSTKHTPTPWRVLGDGKVYGSDDFMVADTSALSSVQPRTMAEMHANAAYIVKAVNCHDAFVQLLTDLEMLVRVNAPLNDGSTIHKAIKAALAKAGAT